MLTEKRKEAVNAILELHKLGNITSDTAMTVIEAVFEDSPSVQYIPLTWPNTVPYVQEPCNPMKPYVTWDSSKTDGGL